MRGILFILMTLTLAMPATGWTANAYAPYQDSSMAEQSGLFGQDLSLTVGLKLMNSTIEFADGYDASSLMYGPSINATFKKRIYAGLNYFTGDGFDYDIDDNYLGELEVRKYEGEATRTDFDLWMGYIFHPRGSVFLSYKQTELDKQASAESVYIPGLTYTQDWDTTLKGPMIGLNGNYPIGNSSFVLFGALGYGFFDVDEEYTQKINTSVSSQAESDSTSSDYRGFSLELGVSYSLPILPQLSLSGGYSYQNYVDTDDDDQELTFSDFAFGVNYRF